MTPVCTNIDHSDDCVFGGKLPLVTSNRHCSSAPVIISAISPGSNAPSSLFLTTEERALNGVRMAGVGPMVAGAPTGHVEQLSIGQPIDITHYAQWGQSMDTPMVDPASFGPPRATMGYTDIVPDLGYGMVPQSGAFHEFSPHLHTSDLSSPSCSE
ncbi:hypothetical protein Q1695_009358 [Nippostrongylus brasiliensis]|nr:hypothetical protein Q1695_009358 [Nippostrongylus brasiliensis]